MKLEILGVKIDKINLSEVVGKISEYLRSDSQHYIVTVNPEFVVAARKNADFRKALNSAAIATCDGVGLVLVSGGKLVRATGVDIVESILLCYPREPACPVGGGGDPIVIGSHKNDKLKIFLLGGEQGSAAALKNKYSNIVGAETGGEVKFISSPSSQGWEEGGCHREWEQSVVLENNKEIIEKINRSGANILLVGFGQVKQEMWISRNLKKMPKVKVAIGVGGTFDYLSGNIKRPPKWLRVLGLEWLFRLITQPKRLKRIWNATAVFGWYVFKEKIT